MATTTMLPGAIAAMTSLYRSRNILSGAAPNDGCGVKSCPGKASWNSPLSAKAFNGGLFKAQMSSLRTTPVLCRWYKDGRSRSFVIIPPPTIVTSRLPDCAVIEEVPFWRREPF